jgi:mannosyltransferase
MTRRADMVAWLIVGLGLALRLATLTQVGLDQDELATVHFATQDLSTVVFGPGFDNHPPVYYLLMHLWIGVAGEGEVALRLPSVVAGTAAVWLAWRVGAALLGPMAGLAGAIGVALVPTHIAMSQNARMYELLVVLALLSMWAMMRFCRRPSIGSMVAYVAATEAMIWTQSAGVFVVVAQNAFWLAMVLRPDPTRPRGRELAWWVAAQLLVLGLHVPWLGVMAERMGVVSGGYWVARESVPRYMAGLFVIFAGTRVYLASLAAAVGMGGLIAWAVWRGLLRREHAPGEGRWDEPAPVAFAATMAVLPPLLVALLSQVIQPIFVPKALLASSVPCYWLAGVGVALLPRLQWRRVAGAAMAVAVLAAGVSQALARPKDEYDLRAILLRLEQRPRDGAAIYLHGWPATERYMARLWREPLPPVLTSRAEAFATALRGWCARPDAAPVLALQVASTELGFLGVLTRAGGAAILTREGLVAEGPDLAGVGRTVLWRCR